MEKVPFSRICVAWADEGQRAQVDWLRASGSIKSERDVSALDAGYRQGWRDAIAALKFNGLVDSARIDYTR